jgi:hypothetical protein
VPERGVAHPPNHEISNRLDHRPDGGRGWR